MLYISVYNKKVNVMQHRLYNICYIISNSRLYNKGGSCYKAKFLLCNKKLCYIAYPNLPDGGACSIILKMAEFGEKFSLYKQLLHSRSYLLNFILEHSKAKLNVKFSCQNYLFQSSCNFQSC